MSRLVFALVALLAVAVGLLVGTLNAESAMLDLLWVQLEWPLGLLLLLFFAGGLLVGLVTLYLSQVLPLRLKIRKLHTRTLAAPPPEPTHDD
jgi:uncharacterized integral membrane protein